MKVNTDAADRVRIDRWLRATHFFKTRSQTMDVVGRGRTQVNGQGVHPVKEVKIDDHVRVHAHEQQWEVEVLVLAEVRGPASVAQTLCTEADASRLERQEGADRHRLYREPATRITDRSTRRGRRRIDKLDGE